MFDEVCADDPADAATTRENDRVESSERARQREITAYLSAASFPPGLPTAFQPVPFLNSDPTLNALTQLGALRLGCDRAFISLIDRQSQYVVTEITRSHSIRSMKSDPGDVLGVGVCKLRNCDGVCPATMKAFMDETGEWIQTGPHVIANRTRYIINNFTTHPDYKDRPYVVGYPYFRSYLEVPLVSPLGYLLGSYCVVDNKHNDFDDDAKVETLNEIADAIMAHLENVRIRQSRDRSEQLIQGLSGFIRHEPPAQHPSHIQSIPEGISAPQDVPAAAVGQPPLEIEPSLGSRSVGSHLEIDAQSSASSGRPPPPNQISASTVDTLQSTTSLSSGPAEGRSETPPTTPRDELSDNPMEQQLAAAVEGQTFGAAPPRPSPPRSEASDSHGFISSANIKTTFFRAAGTIRRSMNMHGLMFLDAVPSSYIDRPDQQHLPGQEHAPDDQVQGPFCTTIVRCTLGPTGETVTHAPQTRLPEASLQRFIRAYPQGHVFTADEFGPIDDSYGLGKPFQSRRKADRESRRLQNDITALFRVLPSAKYVIFLPLWHFQRECWYAATLGWVEDPTRAMEVTDIGLISAFGNSIMAEVSRLEALAASRAKSDFVSSLSHELRSPLHGIMASSELLRENMANSRLLPTLDMLDSCATTLLDTFNNLLDHAIVTHAGRNNGSKAAISELKVTDLGLLVEDVVEAVRVGHLSGNAFHMQTAMQGKPIYNTTASSANVVPDRPLLITVNIAKREDWKVLLNVGAWKRIVMNIFGNALKYTISGRIDVALKLVQRANKAGVMVDYISLSVEDTGLGMSSDYLKYHLFTPFSQENSHSPGMGLGLSIVQQLVSDLDGTINVKSSVSVGTVVEVLVPFDHSREVPAAGEVSDAEAPVVADDKLSVFKEHRSILAGRTLCILTPDICAAICKTLVRTADALPTLKVTEEMRTRAAAVEKAIKVNAVDALGMKMVPLTKEHVLPQADIYVLDSAFVTEVTDNVSELVSTFASSNRLLMLLCSGSGHPSCLKSPAAKGHGLHLHHPIGPRKLASVFCSALRGEINNFIPQVHTINPASASYPAFIEPLPSPAAQVISNKGGDYLTKGVQPLKNSAIQPLNRPFELQEIANHAPRSVDVMAKSTPTKREHLLLVDDNPINMKLLTQVVRKLNHTFATAAHGLEAVQLYKKSLEEEETRFDLVFMDISMPVMDGFEATRAIRQVEVDAGISRCKIVALTGLSGELSRNEATASGCDMFLTKPVKMNTVRRLLDEMRAQREKELGDGE
ncbi:putative signal transduction histidine-protein kinase [Cladorrhinum samala]|uniref:histidine kinase n=1 Tax=Cladorrhinum samala TaxID=585594 RepID=A0AAV9HYA1_9PEZI|nr:putative signal transduction histidine-protein kinase [Cladorrhinum samala]